MANKYVKSGVGTLVGLIVAIMLQEFLDENGDAFSGLASTMADFIVPLYLIGVVVSAISMYAL